MFPSNGIDYPSNFEELFKVILGFQFHVVEITN